MITPTHAQMKRWRKLLLAKYRQRQQAFLAEGGKVVSEVLASGWPLECLLILDNKRDMWRPLWDGELQVPCYSLTEGEWKIISQDRESEGIIAVVNRRPPAPVIVPPNRYLLLYQISNPHNLGAILRTAHWFGVHHVWLSAHSTDVTHPKVVRTSMGSIFHLTIEEDLDFHEAIPSLRAQEVRIIATDVNVGDPPRSRGDRLALLLGNETHGLPGELKSIADECWHIPGYIHGGSLSLPQAAAIIMYELTKGGDDR